MTSIYSTDKKHKMYVCITNPFQTNVSNHIETIQLYHKSTDQFLYDWEHLTDMG